MSVVSQKATRVLCGRTPSGEGIGKRAGGGSFACDGCDVRSGIWRHEASAPCRKVAGTGTPIRCLLLRTREVVHTGANLGEASMEIGEIGWCNGLRVLCEL